MEEKIKRVNVSSELQPIENYVSELHNQKENISVVREFLEGRIAAEKNSETKEVYKIVYNRLAEPEEMLGKIEDILYPKAEVACVNYANAIINTFIEQLNEAIKDKLKKTP